MVNFAQIQLWISGGVRLPAALAQLKRTLRTCFSTLKHFCETSKRIFEQLIQLPKGSCYSISPADLIQLVFMFHANQTLTNGGITDRPS